MRRYRRALVWGGVAAALVILFAAVWAVAWITRDTREDLSISYFDPDEREASGAVRVKAFEGLRDDTARLCAGIEGCIEGYAATYANFYRFAGKDQAGDFAASQEDAYQSDWIVIDYRGSSLSGEDRTFAQEVVDGTWTSE